MRRSLRSFLVVLLTFVFLLGVMPASAFAAVTLTWERNWGSEGPADGQFDNPNDVATDKWGSVYVAGGEADDRVQMFTPTGSFVKSVGPALSPVLQSAMGVAASRWGNIFVADKQAGNIRLFGMNLWDGGYTPIDNALLTLPIRVDVALDQTLYVADNGIEIQRLEPDGTYLNEWGGTDRLFEGAGVSQDGLVYVANRKYHLAPPPNVIDPDRILKYAFDGTYLSMWGGTGSGNGQLMYPADVNVDPAGNVYVADYGNNRIQVFDANGSYLTQVGSSGSGDQQFSGPRGVGVGLDRTLYVADTYNDRISKWKVTTPTTSAVIAGASRITTAVQASKKAYPNGARVVILATAGNWPDALGGAALAGVAKGPLLLVNQNSLPVEVAAEIDRLNAEHVYVLGGTSAVSDPVYSSAVGLTLSHSGGRLWGANRYETANAIAAEVVRIKNEQGGYDGTAFVCTGADFPDALAASPIASANGWPIYLTQPTGLTPIVRTAMIANGTNHGYIVGGENAVYPAVATALNSAPFVGFSRIAGANRYKTALAVANAGFTGMGMLWSRPAIATGTNFPDALAGGVLQGTDCSVLLLTPGTSLDPDVAAALTANKDRIYEIRFLGGDSAVVPVVRAAARSLLW